MITDLAKCICGKHPVVCPVPYRDTWRIECDCGWSGPTHKDADVAECGWNDVMRDYVQAGMAVDDERDELRAEVDTLSKEIARLSKEHEAEIEEYEGIILGMRG